MPLYLLRSCSSSQVDCRDFSGQPVPGQFDCLVLSAPSVPGQLDCLVLPVLPGNFNIDGLSAPFSQDDTVTDPEETKQKCIYIHYIHTDGRMDEQTK